MTETSAHASVRRQPWRWITMAALVAVVVAAPTVIGSDRAQSTLRSAGLLHRDQQFLELAFPEPYAVRDFVSADGAVAMSAALTNRTESTRTVRWIATATADGSDDGVVLDSGVLRIGPGSTERFSARGTIACDVRTRISLEVTAGIADKPGIHLYATPTGADGTVCEVP